MNKFFLLILVLPITILSCKKSSDCGYSTANITASAAEITSLQSYLTAHSITATQHSSGLFYAIDQVGTGAIPSVCSTVTVKYTGSLENGTVFDSNASGIAFTLGELIEGWKKGIPLIKSGGIIRLYIPPSLGYGSTARGSIPANSNLIFTIQLISVQ